MSLEQWPVKDREGMLAATLLSEAVESGVGRFGQFLEPPQNNSSPVTPVNVIQPRTPNTSFRGMAMRRNVCAQVYRGWSRL